MVEQCTQPLLVLYLINGWRLVGDRWMTGKDGSDAAITTSPTASGSRKPGAACPPLRCGGSGLLHTLASASCPRPSVAGWRLGRSAAWAIFR